MLWTRIAAVVGFLGVALGAFGAHGLQGKVPERLLGAYETGVLYHLIHAVALLALGLYSSATQRSVSAPAGVMLAGVVLFSGSLYLMTITGITRFGMITPFGGVAFLVGWVLVLVKLGRAS
jgi:uncharacterized membrane protein YgdD (TMEM256/DUF423 family)